MKRTWNDPFFAITFSLGSPVNDAWFYCYQWFTNFYDVYYTKYDNFVDFGDLYLSFIFNLLGNSLQIRKKTKDMIKSFDRHNDILFWQSTGNLLRIVVDFNSYKTVGVSQKEFEDLSAANHNGSRGVLSKEDRIYGPKLMAKKEKASRPKVKTGEDYEWDTYDYIQAPFGFIIGVLQALP